MERVYSLQFISSAFQDGDKTVTSAKLRAVVYEDGAARVLPGVVYGNLQMGHGEPVSGSVYVIHTLLEDEHLRELLEQFPEVTFRFLTPMEGFAPMVTDVLTTKGLNVVATSPEGVPYFDVACCPIPFIPSEALAVQTVLAEIAKYVGKVAEAAGVPQAEVRVAVRNAPPYPLQEHPEVRISVAIWTTTGAYVGLQGGDIVLPR